MGRRGPIPRKVPTRNRHGEAAAPKVVAAPPPLPDPPDFLDGEAQAEWRRVCDELDRLDVLERTDRAQLSLYCTTWSRWRAAESVLQSSGQTYTAPSGLVKVRPEVRISSEAAAQLRLLLNGMGLTVEARRRMRLEVHDGAPDDFQAFLNRGRGERAG